MTMPRPTMFEVRHADPGFYIFVDIYGNVWHLRRTDDDNMPLVIELRSRA